MDFLYQIAILHLIFLLDIAFGVSRETLIMESAQMCNRVIHNPVAEKGDTYIVKSDDWLGDVPSNRAPEQPETCFLVINLGERVANINLKTWRCDKNFTNLFLGLYDNCQGNLKMTLVSLTCSTNLTDTLVTNGPCVTIYHHRGRTITGYYFALEVVAGQELMSFPAGAMATIVVSSMVAIMVIIKIFCMITGYENRLPKLNLTPEEEKKIMEEAAVHVRLQRAMSAGAEDSNSLLVTAPGEYPTHNSRPAGNGSHISLSGDHPQLDYEFLNADRNTQPRLKRYPSYKASSIFRH